MLTKVFGKEKSFRPAVEILPFSIFSGLAFSVPYVLCAVFFGYEFPSLLAALFGLIVTVFAAKQKWFTPKRTWDFAIVSHENLLVAKMSAQLLCRFSARGRLTF